MARVLALDPSSTHVGWAMFFNGGYIDSGVFVPKGDADSRVAQIVLWTSGMIVRLLANDENGTLCDYIVVIEEPAANNAHRNAKTDRLLSRVGGAIEAMAIFHRAEIARVWPSQVIATGVSKHNPAGACVLAGRGVGPDEADAIGVGLAYFELIVKGF
jgi:hypothetical protein